MKREDIKRAEEGGGPPISLYRKIEEERGRQKNLKREEVERLTHRRVRVGGCHDVGGGIQRVPLPEDKHGRVRFAGAGRALDQTGGAPE